MTLTDEKFDLKGSQARLINKPHIANHYLHAAIRGAERQGHSVAEILGRAEIPVVLLAQPRQLITETQLTRLIKTVWKMTGDEFMGFASHPCGNGFFALMTEFCLSATTLGSMLRRSARFYSTVCEELDIGFEEETGTNDGLVFFRLHLVDSQQDPDCFLQEFLLLMWQRLGCWFVDQSIPFAATQFSYGAPAHIDEYREMYSDEQRFEREVNGFYLHPKYLNLPIVRSEQEVKTFLKESPAYILHRPQQDLSLRTKIRGILSQYDYTAMPSLEVVSAELYLTPRNISRKLKEEGTSFRNIKSILRREYAVKLLTTENLSVSEVSKRVGFSESASFCRAFKRWTGQSPSVWGVNKIF